MEGGCLRCSVDHQTAALIDIADGAAGLEHGVLADAGGVIAFHDNIGLGKALLDIALAKLTHTHARLKFPQVSFGTDLLGIRLHSLPRIKDRSQLFQINLYLGECLHSGILVDGGDSCYDLSSEADLIFS